VGWVRAIVAQPGLARAFVYAMPRVAASVYPPELMGSLAGMAQVFGAVPEPIAAE
jgi:hypothetical protein